MTLTAGPVPSGWSWPSLTRLIAKPGFQRWAARFPLTRRIARRDGERLFDLVQGFVQSQMLFALVSLRIPQRLMDGPKSAADLSPLVNVPPERLERALRAGAAMGLLKMRRDGRFTVARQGAALLGVPGLEQMILHHDVFYRDLSDPVAFLRGEVQTELAEFWPYVFGAAGAVDPGITRTYSDLMAESQGLVAEDTLRTVSLQGVLTLMDVGGGSGAFAIAAARAHKALKATVFDLPVIADEAKARIAQAGLSDRLTFSPGSFRDDRLPDAMDAITLVRVLYDHADVTVVPLLRAVFDALPEGGRLIVSEPMSGGAEPYGPTDVYFSLYCMAMRTGTVRSQARIADLLSQAGFKDVRCPKSARPFVTSVVEARK